MITPLSSLMYSLTFIRNYKTRKIKTTVTCILETCSTRYYKHCTQYGCYESSNIEYVITYYSQFTNHIENNESIILFCKDCKQNVTLGDELLWLDKHMNSVVAIVTDVHHSILINSYSTWILQFSWFVSFTTKAM